MASERSGGSRNASDKKLDQAATAEHAHDDEKSASHPTHDPAKIKQHNDTGKDRLFEDRQQHDEAEKNSEKTRLARDVERHHHPVNEHEADSGTSQSGKRKN